MNRNMEVLLAVVCLCSCVVSCQQPGGLERAASRPIPTMKGTITVVVSENVEGSRQWAEHTINIETGSEETIAEPVVYVPERLLSGGHLGNGADLRVMSPDGQWIAILASPQSMTLLDSRGHQYLQHAIPSPWSVGGVAWSPDSKALVLLLRYARTEAFSLRGVGAIVLGHPLLVSDYKLLLLNFTHPEAQPMEILVHKDAVAGWAAVRWE